MNRLKLNEWIWIFWKHSHTNNTRAIDIWEAIHVSYYIHKKKKKAKGFDFYGVAESAWHFLEQNDGAVALA